MAATALTCAAAIPASATTAAPASVLENRQQCRADTVRVYSAPDGNGYWTGAVIHNGIYVNVDDHYNGVWWHINAPYGGWVLAEYFC